MTATMDPLHGKRLVILGIARQGTALARFAVGAGAYVTLSDMRPAEKLESVIESLSDLPAGCLRLVLGDHPAALLDECDVLALSGGVATDLPIVVEAGRRGIPLTNDSLEFMRRAPAPVVGITGSAGKTTTTALLGEIGQKSGRRTWVGGNIGRPLISDLEKMSAEDLIVKELSSFQLELWQDCSPAIAAILNITPNHLDRHKSMASYTEAKSHILMHQKSDDVAVLSADDSATAQLQELVRGRLRLFSRNGSVEDGAYVQDGQIWLSTMAGQQPLMPVESIRLRGRHNVLNVLAAVVLADSAGISREAIVEGILAFSGVPHRLEFVRKLEGVQYFNDSIATAPERALAALDSFDEPIILLAGGRDKDMVWDNWAQQVTRRVKHVVLFGELASKQKELLNKNVPMDKVDTLAEAVSIAREKAVSGDVVLLSPGGTSFDSYFDFAERGEHFRLLVRDLE